MRAFLFLLLAISLSAEASIPPLQTNFKKTNKYVESGSLVGGTAQRDLILAGVRRTYSKAQNMERIILDVEATKGQIERFGYFQIQVDPKLNRIVIDLNGVAASQQPLESAVSTLRKSPYISNVALTMDPEDRSANMTLSLNGRATYKVEAFELPVVKTGSKQTARLAIDIFSKGQ